MYACIQVVIKHQLQHCSYKTKVKRTEHNAKFTVDKFSSMLFSNRYVRSKTAWCMQYNGTLSRICKKRIVLTWLVCQWLNSSGLFTERSNTIRCFVFPPGKCAMTQKVFRFDFNRVLVNKKGGGKNSIKIEPVVNIVVATNKNNFNYHNEIDRLGQKILPFRQKINIYNGIIVRQWIAFVIVFIVKKQTL